MSVETVDVQGVFSAIANKYDRLNTILTWNIDEHWRKKLIKLSGIKPGDKVLDVCCGTCKMLELECKAVGAATEVIGVDFNENMIKVGRQNLEKSVKGYRYKLIHGNALELPFEENTFDYVIISFGLRNLTDRERALGGFRKVLKPGGKIICLELSNPELPGLKQIYGLYLQRFLPIIGLLGTRNKTAYYYLRDSVKEFMSKEQLKALGQSLGLSNCSYVSLAFGIASIHFGTK